MSSTANFSAAIDRFAAAATAQAIQAPQTVALALWQLLVDATPVLSGLTRSNWRLGVNAILEGPTRQLSAKEYGYRQRHDEPLPPPERPTLGPAKPGNIYYISNGTVDPYGHQYWPKILDGTPSQPRPWFRLSILEIETRAPELIRAQAFTKPTIIEVGEA